MPRVSDYELEHGSDQVMFEKVRSKRSKVSKEKTPEKKKHRQKKIDL